MKILFITSALLPFDVHGVSVHVEKLSEALAEIGDVTILYTLPIAATSGSKEFRVETRGNVKIVFPPNPQGIQTSADTSSPFQWVMASSLIYCSLNEILAYVEANNFSVIHLQDYYSAIGIEIAKKLPNIVTISTVHALAESSNHFSEGVRKWMVLNSDITISISDWQTKQMLQRFSISPESVCTIYNGVSYPDHFILGEDYITFAGRLEWKKGCDILLHAAAKLGKDYFTSRNKKLLIIGTGSQKENLEKLSHKLAIDDICKFVGEIQPSEVTRLLAKSAVHIVPSRLEPFGLSAVESLVLGKPTIVARIGGLTEIVKKNRLGFIFPSESVNDLANCIYKVLENPISETVREEERLKIANKFSWTKAAEETYALYEKVIHNKSLQ